MKTKANNAAANTGGNILRLGTARKATVALFVTTLCAAAASCSSTSGSGSASANTTPGSASSTSAVAASSPNTTDSSSAAGGGSSTPASAASDPASLLPAQYRGGTIVTGGPEAVPPLVFLNSAGDTLTGFVPDLADALGKKLGVTIKYENMAFPSVLPALQSGKLQIELGVMSDTKARQKVLDFVDFLNDGVVILVQKGNPLKIGSLDDLCGKTAAVLQGSIASGIVDAQQSKCTDAGKSKITKQEYPDINSAELKVKSGAVAATFGGNAQFTYFTKQPAGAAFEIAPGGMYNVSPFGIGILKSNTQLTTAFKAALQALIDDGTYKQIIDKWGLQSGAVTAAQLNSSQQ